MVNRGWWWLIQNWCRWTMVDDCKWMLMMDMFTGLLSFSGWLASIFRESMVKRTLKSRWNDEIPGEWVSTNSKPCHILDSHTIEHHCFVGGGLIEDPLADRTQSSKPFCRETPTLHVFPLLHVLGRGQGSSCQNCQTQRGRVRQQYVYVFGISLGPDGSS